MSSVSRREFLGSAGAGLAGATLALPVFAQSPAYPNKPILLKVAFPAGGPADASLRAAGVVLQRELAQPLIADNMTGANGSIATMAVAKAQADGYTLLGTTGIDFMVAPFMVASAKYVPTDFRLLGITGMSDFALVSSPSHSFRNVDELIEYAKKPGSKELSIAHWGTGSAPHIVAADFQERVGVKFLEVPYKGAAPAMADLAGSQIDLTFVPLGGGPATGMIKTGKMKAIGVASAKRVAALPNVPAFAESRTLKDFQYALWAGVLAPPKTPDAVVARMNHAMNNWLKSAENQERIAANISRQLDPMTPEQAAEFLRGEYEKFNRVARSLKLQPR